MFIFEHGLNGLNGFVGAMLGIFTYNYHKFVHIIIH